MRFGGVLPIPGTRPPAASRAPFDADGTTFEGRPAPDTGPPPSSPRQDPLTTSAAPLQALAPEQRGTGEETKEDLRKPGEPQVLLTGPFQVVLPLPRPGAAAPPQAVGGLPAAPAPLPSLQAPGYAGPGTLSDAPTTERGAPIPTLVVPGLQLGRSLAADPGLELHAATHPQHGPCVVRSLTTAAAAAGAARPFLVDARARTALESPERVLAHGDAPRPWAAEPTPPGPTLAERRPEPWPAERVAAVALDGARSLARLHARRVVHGDLRPEAVVVTGARVSFVGFGAPVEVGKDGVRRAFRGGPPLGPARWAAPERLRGGPPGAPSDVWGLALVCASLRLGRSPIEEAGDDPAAVARALLAGPALPGAEGDPLLGALARCLAVDPGARPTAQGLAEALLVAQPRRGGLLLVLLGAGALLAIAALVLALVLRA
jgi:hypothetical protein